MGKLIFVTGGARSGKSCWAEELAAKAGRRVVYLATCVPQDEEMTARVKLHQQRRPAAWLTVEEPLEVAGVISRVAPQAEAILVDCLTLWLTNRLFAGRPLLGEADFNLADLDLDQLAPDILAQADAMVEAARASRATVVIVSNEIGLGIVPGAPLSRLYRDLLGWVNQRVAARADEVYLVTAGIPIEIKCLDARRAYKEGTP